jgi:hypothetical protein
VLTTLPASQWRFREFDGMCSARCETCILFHGLWFAKNTTGFGHLSGVGKIDLHVRFALQPKD